MQQISDLRKQVAATALEPIGITSLWGRVWAKQLYSLIAEAPLARQKVDTSFLYSIQDFNSGSSSFGAVSQAFLEENDLPDPFNTGPA